MKEIIKDLKKLADVHANIAKELGEINKTTEQKLEDWFWANNAKHNEDESGLEHFLIGVAEGDIENPLTKSKTEQEWKDEMIQKANEIMEEENELLKADMINNPKKYEDE